MKVWIAFLLLSFVLGGRAVRHGRPQRLWPTLALCALVAIVLSTQRFI